MCGMRIGIPPFDVCAIVRRASARFKGYRNSGYELDVLRADDPVWRLLVALQLAGIREYVGLVVKIDQRFVGIDLGQRFFVSRLPLGRLSNRPALPDRALRSPVA